MSKNRKAKVQFFKYPFYFLKRNISQKSFPSLASITIVILLLVVLSFVYTSIKSKTGAVALVQDWDPAKPSHPVLYTDDIKSKTGNFINVESNFAVKGSLFQFIDSATLNGLTIRRDSPTGPINIHSDWARGGAEKDLAIGTYTNRGNQLYLATSGNVGIGTTSPGSTMTVKTGSTGVATGLSLWNDFNGVGSGTRLSFSTRGLENSAGGEAAIEVTRTINGANMDFKVKDDASSLLTSRMYIDKNGNIGIATQSPISQLHIKGYLQLDVISTPPPQEDCNEAIEEGRMKFDPIKDVLYICSGVSGWVSK